MKCPNCGYKRQKRDNAFVPATECPSCGIVYAKHEGSVTPGAPNAMIGQGPPLRPSVVDPESLKKAKERVEKRLRNRLETPLRDERHAETLKLARRIAGNTVLRQQENEVAKEAENEALTESNPIDAPEEDPLLLEDAIGVSIHQGASSPAPETPAPKSPAEIAPSETEEKEANADKVEADTLEADTLKADSLEADTLEADTLEADTLETDTLEADTLEADTLEADSLEADTLEADTLEADTLEADTLEADSLEADTLEADTLEADTLDADTLEADTLEADTLKADSFEAGSLEDDQTTVSETTPREASPSAYPQDVQVETIVLETAEPVMAEIPEFNTSPPDGPLPQAQEEPCTDAAPELPPAFIAGEAMRQNGPETTTGSSLKRLLPIVAWLILFSGVVGAVLSWTTISDVEASTRAAGSSGYSGLPIGLLLGFAYLATGALGFTVFWVSSSINRQLKDIRRLLMVHPISMPYEETETE